MQRYLAAAGVAARRKAEELITAGRVTVNGEVVRVLGTKVDPERDEVQVDGEAVVAHDRAVDAHAPGGDQLLDVAAGADAGVGQVLVQAFLHTVILSGWPAEQGGSVRSAPIYRGVRPRRPR